MTDIAIHPSDWPVYYNTYIDKMDLGLKADFRPLFKGLGLVQSKPKLQEC